MVDASELFVKGRRVNELSAENISLIINATKNDSDISILSKNGYPYKIAVAEVKEGQRILGNGNLYIIELDEEKADPYYLAAFFGSEQGTAALRSRTVGATIPNIGVEQLTKLVIPIPPLENRKRLLKNIRL